MPWPTFLAPASSSAASSTFRPRWVIGAATAIFAASSAYYIYTSYDGQLPEPSVLGNGLHRSNAQRNPVHRTRRRRNTATAGDDPSLPLEEQEVENVEGNLVSRTLTDGETVVDDQAWQEEYAWQNVPPTYERNGQNIVQLLFRVSEDATRRNAYVHRGCACNGCAVVPIRGIRYRCANCADYDLCEGCESQGLHIKTHIFYKIKVPAPAFGPRHLQPVWYSGDPDSIMRVLPKETWTKLSRETGFERPELDAYWEQWTFMANTDWRDDPDDLNLAMDRKTFERCLVPSGGYRHTAPSLIFDRMFAFYDTNKDDLIGFPEFLHGIAFRRKKDKWKKVFEGYDIDGDGLVDRKDFLRMFRSYYVLHRQLHRDMLEGMEEQQMSSIDAHRLVSTRQPLSSAFGQDGRYPRAPDIRNGEGKAAQANGDYDIVDGKGVLNESTTDTGNREDIFRRDGSDLGWMRSGGRHRHDSSGSRYQPSGYWETMLNPPENAEQARARLANSADAIMNGLDETPIADRPWTRGIDGRPNTATSPGQIEILDDDSSHSDGENTSSQWPPSYVTVTDEDAEAIDGPGTRVEDVRQSSRGAVAAHALFRQRAQREIHERWQRRHFYTDEEEGATPPQNWKEDDDILAINGMAGESSKSSSRPVIHSRSSSKVRFAEDMDDFDTRSNPSTSSRSVPERWGGIEIPDAEKDAGKEILYQVTQQAFNELLDPLFKAKEDLAIEAAETRLERDRNRDILMMPEFIKWASMKSTAELKANRIGTSGDRETWGIEPEAQVDVEERGIVIWPPFPEVEIEQVRQRPLEELLDATGYSIVDENGENEEVLPFGPIDPLMKDDEQGSHLPDVPVPPTSPSEPEFHPHASGSFESTTPADSPTYRDPTLPQFRPNTIEDVVDIPSPITPPKVEAEPEAEERVTKERLYKLWQVEEAITDMKEKGGWGRLDYEEFEALVRRFVREGGGNQMDYLGTWIEFCIP